MIILEFQRKKINELDTEWYRYYDGETKYKFKVYLCSLFDLSNLSHEQIDIIFEAAWTTEHAWEELTLWHVVNDFENFLGVAQKLLKK